MPSRHHHQRLIVVVVSISRGCVRLAQVACLARRTTTIRQVGKLLQMIIIIKQYSRVARAEVGQEYAKYFMTRP